MQRRTLLVGNGPANLALLTSLKEMQSPVLDTLTVLERRDSAAWHPGLEFKNSTLQVSLFKDLAFLRNPSSPFTFLAFLRDRGLLHDFIHTNTLYPSRNLFSQYLEWISRFFAEQIVYRKEVVKIAYGGGQQRKRLIATIRDRRNEDLSEEVFDDLVIGLGHEPYIPPELAVCDNLVVHSNVFLMGSKRLMKPNMRVAVVGSGQSAGEITRHLLQRDDVAEVVVIGRRHLFQQTDDNPFVNDLYTNPRALMFSTLPNEQKERFRGDVRNTNFSTVTRDVLNDIYDLAFDDRARRRSRLKLFSYTQIEQAEARDGGVRLQLGSVYKAPVPGLVTALDVDMLVCATGFRNTRHLSLIQPLQPRMEGNEVVVDDTFRVDFGPLSRSNHEAMPRVFLLNHSPQQRGPTEHTLAGLAERAAVVAEALRCERVATGLHSSDLAPSAMRPLAGGVLADGRHHSCN